jgi:5-(aminomethyl)-3-furanmethanol phosphate kinase
LSLTVIKLGGSLMGSAELSSWLKSIELISKQNNIVIVPGGGKFADSVRDLQKIYHFNDLSAHSMALLAMCQFGYLLAGINSNIKVVDDLEKLQSSLGNQLPILWLPLSLTADQTEIEASWDFTSDSIALWLATKLSAENLVLVKSKSLNNDRKNIVDHINNGDIDKGFQQLSDKYSGEITFFEKSQSHLITQIIS